MKPQEKNNSLEDQMLILTKSQQEFTSKALLILSLGVKNIYSKEEAAVFLNLDPQYMYQLKHQNKIPAYKMKGQKKIYFKKEDLENYLLSESENEPDFDNFEEEVKAIWNKK